MTRYLRLGYLVPRLLALVVLLLATEIGSGWALKWAATGAGQEMVGAKVEIGASKVSLLRTSASLAGVRIANPNRPMENLLEAERIDLDFDSGALTHRSAVARGAVRGLRFGTPRDESGALDPKDPAEAGGAAPVWLAGAQQAAGDAAERWIADLESKLTGEADEFESVRLAEELSEEWPAKWRELREEADAIEADFKAIKQQATDARRNPLRYADFIREAPAQGAELQARLAELADEVKRLPQLAQADRQRIEAARRADQRHLRERLSADQLDADSLTSQLLGEEVTGAVQQLVGWVRWARELAPTKQPDQRLSPAERGTNVRFVGVRPRPALLLTELQFDGVTQLLGRGVELRGRLTDYCSMPSAHGEPLRIVAEAAGAAPMRIEATLDRRTGEPVDTLLARCERLPLPGGKLGKESKLAVRLAPTTAVVAMDLRVEGERLTGRVNMQHENVGLEPVVGPHAGAVAQRFGGSLQRSLAAIDRAETTVLLGGNLDRPTTELRSDLGQSLATALQGAAAGVAQAEVQKRFDAGQKQVDQRLAEFEARLNEAAADLTERLSGPRKELESLASTWLPGGFPTRGFSIEQLGRRLGGETQRK